MSKIPELTDENKRFMKRVNITLEDIARYFDMKPITLRNSTAKNRYIEALAAYSAQRDATRIVAICKDCKEPIESINLEIPCQCCGGDDRLNLVDD